MRFLSTVLVPLLFATPVAWAHEGVKDPGVMARMHAMKSIGTSSKVLRQMASGRIAFDAVDAEAAKTALIRHLEDTEGLFKEPHTDPKSEALPAIWETFEDFRAKTDAAILKARALDVGSVEGIRATLPASGQTCVACHEAYRVD